ncbi:MAG: hypothetical protein RLZZ230_25 [Candidatus Parcubacteria bacterium]|jgi:hypothetical protein
MEDNTDIIKIIENARPELSESVSLSLWNNIESKLNPSTPVIQPTPSPFTKLFSFKNTYSMTSLALLLILALGGGATAFASDAARPGDILFPVERAIENLQLRLTLNAEAHDALVQKLTDERLAELRSIIDEEITVSPSNTDDTASSTATSTDSTLEIEATVFTDTTVVRIQIEGKKFYFETTATTSVDTLIVIQEKFPMLTDAMIIETMDFAVENRASRPKDRGVVSLSNEGQARVDKAVAELLSFLDSVDTEDLNKTELMSLINSEIKTDNQSRKVRQDRDGIHIGNNDSRFEIKMNDDGDSKIEIRGESNEKIQVEKKGDTIKVQSDNREKETVRKSTVSASSTLPDFTAIANIFTDKTIVTLTFGKDSVYVETAATTRAEIIAAILNDFPALTQVQVDEQLVIKNDNRSSQPADSGLANLIPNNVVAPKIYKDDEGGESERDGDDERENKSESEHDGENENDD